MLTYSLRCGPTRPHVQTCLCINERLMCLLPLCLTYLQHPSIVMSQCCVQTDQPTKKEEENVQAKDCLIGLTFQS